MGRCRSCRQRPNGEASSTRDSHPEKIAQSLREAGGQAKAQRGPAPSRACSGGSERSKDWLGTQKAGLRQCWARCLGPRTRVLQRAPPPPPCLVLGCKHKENKFRFPGNIYLRQCGERVLASACPSCGLAWGRR